MIKAESALPMYKQIASILTKEIREHRYGDGGSIGTHTDLAERFGVSLITIRKAIKILADENLVETQQGKGTFAKSTILQDDLHHLTGVSNIISQQNLQAQVVVRTMSFVETPQHFSDKTKEAMGDICLYVERLHVIDEVVIGYAKLYLPLFYGRRLSRKDIEEKTIYQLYEDKLGVKLGKGVQYISADMADDEMAETLEVDAGTPILRVERESYAADGTLIEIMELFYEYSHYRFRVELDLASR